jgi:hypothetical protein
MNNLNLNNNIFGKSENLRNMMNKITEDAQKANQISDDSKIKLENYFNKENYFNLGRDNRDFRQDFHNNINNIEKLFKNEKTNENYTQEYIMERYKNYLPCNMKTPTDFNKNILLNSSNTNRPIHLYENKRNLFDEVNSIVLAKIRLNKISSFKITNWLLAFKTLNRDTVPTFDSLMNSEKNSGILETITSYFGEYSVSQNKNLIICEIEKIKEIDCRKVLVLKDIQLNIFELIVIEGEIDLETLIFNEEIIKDFNFQENDVVLVNLDSQREITCNGGKMKIVQSKFIKLLS